MAKSNPTKEIEILPDGWQRFERAAGVVAKTPPQHREKKLKPKKPSRLSGTGKRRAKPA
jgi:hypothetical protein